LLYDEAPGDNGAPPCAAAVDSEVPVGVCAAQIDAVAMVRMIVAKTDLRSPAANRRRESRFALDLTLQFLIIGEANNIHSLIWSLKLLNSAVRGA